MTACHQSVTQHVGKWRKECIRHHHHRKNPSLASCKYLNAKRNSFETSRKARQICRSGLVSKTRCMIENGRELIGGVDDALVLAMIEWRYVFGDCVAYTDVVWVRGGCVPTALASILEAIGKTCSRRLMHKSHCRKQYASVKGRWSYRLFDVAKSDQIQVPRSELPS